MGRKWDLGREEIKLNLRRQNWFLPIFTIWFVVDILFLSNLYESENLKMINLFVDYMSLILLMIQILFFQEYTKKELVVIGIITAIIIPFTIVSGYVKLMNVWIFVVASKKCSFEDTIRRAYHVLLIMIPIIVLSSRIGLIEDTVRYRNGIVRYSLGFAHPNTLGMKIFQLLACHFYIRREKLNIWDYLFLMAAIVFTYTVPNSQTSYISMMVLLLGILLNHFANKLGTSFSHIYSACLIAMAALFNILSVMWSLIGIKDNSALATLDRFLSNRFSVCHRTFQIFGATLLGNPTLTTGTYTISGQMETLFLDNAYMVLLLRYGIVAYILFSFVYGANLIRCRRSSQNMLLIILFCYALYGVMEEGLYLLNVNIFLLTFSGLLFGENSHSIVTTGKIKTISGVRNENRTNSER